MYNVRIRKYKILVGSLIDLRFLFILNTYSIIDIEYLDFRAFFMNDVFRVRSIIFRSSVYINFIII